MNRILLVDTDQEMLLVLADELVPEGYDVSTTGNYQGILSFSERHIPDIILVNASLKDDPRILEQIKKMSAISHLVFYGIRPPKHMDLHSLHAQFCTVRGSDLGELKSRIRKLTGLKDGRKRPRKGMAGVWRNEKAEEKKDISTRQE